MGCPLKWLGFIEWHFYFPEVKKGWYRSMIQEQIIQISLQDEISKPQGSVIPLKPEDAPVFSGFLSDFGPGWKE